MVVIRTAATIAAVGWAILRATEDAIAYYVRRATR